MSLLPNVLFRITNANGQSISGGKAFFYLTGTNTLHSVYADADLSTPLANPVVADGAGLLAAIYLDDDVTYRCKITDANGTTLADIDPVNATAASEVNAFAYIPANLQSAISAGTSTVDVTTYLQAAHDASLCVRYPEGLFRVTDSINLRSRAQAIGSGYGTCIKFLGNVGNKPMFQNADRQPVNDAARNYGISVKNLLCDGNRAGNTSATEFSHAVQLWAVARADVDIWAENFKGDGVALGSPQDSDTTIPCEDITVRLRALNCYRNSLTASAVRKLIFDVISTGAGLCGVCLECDDGANGKSSIHDVTGRLVDLNSGVDYPSGGSATGSSFRADSNTSVLNNVIVDVVSRGHQDNGVDWRGAKGLNIRAVVEDCGGTGARGIDGTAVTSEVTLDLTVRGSGARALSTESIAGSITNVTRLLAIDGGGDTDLLMVNHTGILNGVTAPKGVALDTCTDVRLVSPDITGTFLALQLIDCTNIKIDGGRIEGGSSAITESGTTDYTRGQGIEFPTAGCNLIGANSVVSSVDLFADEAAYNPGTVAANSSVTKTLTVPGLDSTYGMILAADFSVTLGPVSLAYSRQPGTQSASVNFINPTASGSAPGAGTLSVTARNVYRA